MISQQWFHVLSLRCYIHLLCFRDIFCKDRFSLMFCSSASWDRDELVRFWCHKVKCQGHRMTMHCLYSLVSCKIYDSFLPEDYHGRLIRGLWNFLLLAELHIFLYNQCSVHTLVNAFVCLSHKLQMDIFTARLRVCLILKWYSDRVFCYGI